MNVPNVCPRCGHNDFTELALVEDEGRDVTIYECHGCHGKFDTDETIYEFDTDETIYECHGCHGKFDDAALAYICGDECPR